jgi:Fic family protein
MKGGFPLSLRLIREMHEKLLARGRGSSKAPGEFRTSQNWIGGTRPGNAAFVPPPPHQVPGCLGAFEKFLHGEPVRVPVLQRAALAHFQFETIHPFLDGNGRLGRLLVPLLLVAEDVLQEPTLYLSLYFKTHKQTYYERLQRVRTHGEWEEWVRFFIEGVLETAQQAVTAATQILKLFSEDRKRLSANKRHANAALRVHDVFMRKPIISIKQAADQSGLTPPTVTTALQHLETLGLVRETTGRQRGRLFVYQPYLDLLNEGTTIEKLPGAT